MICRSTLNPCVWAFPFRASSECRPAGEDPSERRVQRQEGQVTAAQVGGAAGHPLWHLSNRGLCQRQPDWEDAHPAPGGRKGKSSLFVSHTTFHFSHCNNTAWLNIWMGIDHRLS